MKFFKLKYTAFIITFYLFLVDTQAFAQATPSVSNSKTKLKYLLEQSTFKTGITIVIGGIALYQWFEYFNNFDFNNAFLSVLKPASLTFLTFNWIVFAKWIGIV